MNLELYKKIKNYTPFNIQEEKDKEIMLEFISKFDNVLERENIFGHFTTSCWIVNPSLTKVLCIYHKIYNSWGWVGGHNDGESDFIKVALKEAKEETGLDVNVLDDQIFAIDVLPVINHIKKGQFISSHLHFNFTFLCVADENDELILNTEETEGVAWIELDEINNHVSPYDEGMKKVYSKLNQKLFTNKSKYLK